MLKLSKLILTSVQSCFSTLYDWLKNSRQLLSSTNQDQSRLDHWHFPALLARYNPLFPSLFLGHVSCCEFLLVQLIVLNTIPVVIVR